MDEVCPSLFDDILEGISDSKGVKESAGDEGISLGEEETGRQHRSASVVHFAMMDKTRQILDSKKRNKKLWKLAADRGLDETLKTDWSEIVGEEPVEIAKRLRFDGRKWSEDKIKLRIQKKPFANGAMRECYRAQKLGNFSLKSDWKYASNVVLKKYIEDVDKCVLFEDITLQMESKLWANEYNRRNPPKKIDVMQICIVQLIDRKDAPFFQMENFIDGKYVKYNSNSGFIGNDRMTPQTFSHFTFEVSNSEKMVIDIQGVNDLWTDPQIHSANGLDYGDGNLGVRGMALFFLSHTCSSLCDFFNLPKFEKHESEETGSQLHKAVESTLASLTKVESQRRRFDRISSRHDSGMESLVEEPINPRVRHLSACSQMSDDSGACGSLSLKTIDEEVVSLSPKVSKEEILVAIHYAVCQLYCQERIAFSNDASIFHLKIAAEGGHLEALTIYARKLLGIQTDVLEEIVVEPNPSEGFKYLEKAASLGDSYSTFLIANAYQSGDGLPDGVEKNWEKACGLLTELIDSRTEIGVPVYKLMEEKAKMLQEGGNGLEQNATEAAETFEWAAEEATCAMKGKQAAKYFEMAEIAWSLVE